MSMQTRSVGKARISGKRADFSLLKTTRPPFAFSSLDNISYDSIGSNVGVLFWGILREPCSLPA